MLGKWATDATTGLKLFLTLVANQPVRRLLFYILKHESKKAFQADLKQLCEQYLFNLESLELEEDEVAQSMHGFSTWCSGELTQSSLDDLAAHLGNPELLEELIQKFGPSTMNSLSVGQICTMTRRFLLAGRC
eukprot:g29855.t1